jgi:branched-chain amino acid transport system permease protein
VSAVGAASRRLPAWLTARALAAFLVGLVVLYAAPLVIPLGTYRQGLVTQAFIFVAAALAWNWLGGYVGQVSFGHAAMFGVGGFTSARLLLSGVPMPMAWVVGGFVAAGFGVLWGHPMLRLRGPYFTIATIGVGEATRLAATFWQDFTGGSTGTSLPIQGDLQFRIYWYALYFMAFVIVLSYYLRKSRIGLGLLSIKEDVEAAGDVGVNATLYQDVVLVMSSFVVGVCGALYASYQSFIEPQDMFGFERAISFVLMAVVGGIGTILGPVLGAAVFVIIEQTLIASFPDLYLGLYGVLLVLIILFEPLGLSGLILRVATRVGYRPAAGVAAGGLASSAAGTAPVGNEAGTTKLEQAKT